MKWWPFKRSKQKTLEDLLSEASIPDLSYYLEMEQLEEAEGFLKKGGTFDDFVFVNLCRDNKKKSLELCLKYWDQREANSPQGFIDSSLIFCLENENLNLFKNLLEKKLSHKNLMYEIITKQNLPALLYYWGLDSYNPRENVDIKNSQVLDFLLEYPRLMYQLIKEAELKREKLYFLDILLCHEPSLYYVFDLESLFPKLELVTRKKIITYANNFYKLNLPLDLKELKSVHGGASNFYSLSMSNLRKDMEDIYTHRIHRPLLRSIAKEAQEGNFSWLNTLFWTKNHTEFFNQDLLLNLGSFSITKAYSPGENLDNWELKIRTIIEFLIKRSTPQQAHKILSSLKDFQFHLDDVYFYTNHRAFQTPIRLEAVNFGEMHDELGLVVAKENHKNFSLNQNNLHKDLHGKSVDSFTINIPLESQDLLLLGNVLKICVGTAGYARRCLEGKIYILILEKDKEKICVEYNRETYKIIQARSLFNKEEIHRPEIKILDQMIVKADIARERDRQKITKQ